MDLDALRIKVAALIRDEAYKPLKVEELAKQLGVPKGKLPEFLKLIKQLEAGGELYITKTNKAAAPERAGYRSAKILSLTKTGGFAALTDGSGEIFIPKGRLRGAMPSDVVEVRIFSRTGRHPEAEVVRLLERNFTEFTGTFVKRGKRAYILPDGGLKEKLRVASKDIRQARDRDKVFARMKQYPERGREGLAGIIASYGPADSAAACCAAVLDRMHIRRDFPAQVDEEAARVCSIPLDTEGRLDLRDKVIFTIDSEHAKDLDDAVSIEKLEDGYLLGVHIADVSYYVRPESALDREAMLRGTSVYYADTVIPMLPRALSNGVCSLNPQEDRLAFSVLITLDENGAMRSYELKKSVIRSCVKGVYEEINRIIGGAADRRIREKYAHIMPSLEIMLRLAAILRAAREKRGALDFDSSECEIVLGDDGVAADIRRSRPGPAERLIEEFMLLANEAVATFARRLEIPFIYRVHEEPDPQKLEALCAALKLAGISARGIHPGLEPKDIAEVLAKIAGTPKARALNDMVLRSLAKARYSPECLGHFGLALKYYCHFTSPIRRYPDLAVHRILSTALENGGNRRAADQYRAFVAQAAEQSSLCEITAMQLEWACEDIYKAEYMSSHIGETFDGIVTSVKSYGMYVELENTVEGMVRLESMKGRYEYDEPGMTLYCRQNGKRYSIGDSVRVLAARADVANGQVDFELI